MKLEATIKDDGDYVRCVSQDGNKRRTFTVQLNDFIEAIASINSENQVEYFPRNGKLPETLYDFQLGRNCTGFTCHAVFRFPSEKQLITFCNETFYVLMPTLIFDMHVFNGKLEQGISRVFAENKDGKLCSCPMSNVYADGHICWGSVRVPSVKNFKELEDVCKLFIHAPGNSDLTGFFRNTKYGSLGNLLKVLETAEEFPEDAYNVFKNKIESLF